MKYKTNGVFNFKKVNRKNLNTSLVLVPILSIFLFSCGANMEDRFATENAKAKMDSVRSVATSNAAVVGKADSTHTFIRTADIKFKVKDVKQSADKYRIFASEAKIKVTGLDARDKVEVFDIAGRKIKSAVQSEIAVKPGLYIVKVNTQVTKVIVK